MILCNGSPKTGTHLLQRAVQLFDVPVTFAYHDHKPFGQIVEPAFTHHVHIIRSPRNVAVSWARFMNGSRVTRQTLKEAIAHVIPEIQKYLGWLGDKDCHTVRFEDLLTDPQEIVRLGQYLGLVPTEQHFENLWGGTQTFTGKLSLWQKHVKKDFEAQWQAHGGIELERALGYDPHLQFVRNLNG